ncbi:MAG TPA: ornithine cyclodeaminase family protein [Actinomycetota bacterium]|nr:ornithine cyclodeaminase family protein [Actinomycetota bacterium]
MKYIAPEDLQKILPMKAAVDALEFAFGDAAPPEAPQRMHVAVPGGTLLLMPAAGDMGTGVKLVTLNPSNPGRGLPFIHGTYMLFRPNDLAPECVIDGGALTALRTAAVSGLATRHLARGDAHGLVIFGAGVQGHSHLDAMATERRLRRVTVVSRTRQPAEALASRARALGFEGAVGDASAVATADIVCTCTTSNDPVFDGSLLPDGCHVNAVGAYQPHTRELDDDAVLRGRVVVETREAALEEAGDLLIPIDAGVITRDHIVAELGEVVRGREVRSSDEDITVFKSVGVAFEDLVLARAAADRVKS